MGEDIVWAVKNGDLDEVKEHLSDPNVAIKGKLLLVTASDYGQVDVILYLIKAGADVNKSDANGITPLLAAIWEDHFEAVKVLLKNGANKSGSCPDGSSYLDAASSDEIKLLLK